MTKVLIIEDEPQHVKLVRMRLEANGLQVASASTAAEGVSEAFRQGPDIILLDLLLPDMPPEKAISALRAVPCAAKVPILAFTALDPLEIRRRRLDCELAGVVTKPYEPAELLAKISELVKK